MKNIELNEEAALFSRVRERFQAYYKTEFGAAYLCNSLDFLKYLPDNSVDLIITSPPYALHFEKVYGNVSKDRYVDWFFEYAKEIFRILSKTGSFVLNIGGSYNKGVPTRSLYQFKLLIRLVEDIGFHLAQEFFWHNPAKMPMPAEWVTVRKLRVKDSVEYLWWLSKTEWPKASNQNVLKASFSSDMYRLNQRGLKESTRPGGYKIRKSWSEIKTKGSIPSNFIQESFFESDFSEKFDNVIISGNNAANDAYTRRCKESGLAVHPARFPRALPEFFIKMLTETGDTVLDPFAGSNTTGEVAEALLRRWIACEQIEEYIEGSRFRFFDV